MLLRKFCTNGWFSKSWLEARLEACSHVHQFSPFYPYVGETGWIIPTVLVSFSVIIYQLTYTFNQKIVLASFGYLSLATELSWNRNGVTFIRNHHPRWLNPDFKRFGSCTQKLQLIPHTSHTWKCSTVTQHVIFNRSTAMFSRRTVWKRSRICWGGRPTTEQMLRKSFQCVSFVQTDQPEYHLRFSCRIVSFPCN